MNKTLMIAIIAGMSVNVLAAERATSPAASTPLNIIQAVQKKPDYVVEHAGKIGGSDTQLMVKIRNAGNADAPSALAQAMNMTPGVGGSATQPFSPIKAGSFIWIKMTLSKAPGPDARILIRLDHNKAVAESNETNNDYYFNW